MGARGAAALPRRGAAAHRHPERPAPRRAPPAAAGALQAGAGDGDAGAGAGAARGRGHVRGDVSPHAAGPEGGLRPGHRVRPAAARRPLRRVLALHLLLRGGGRLGALRQAQAPGGQKEQAVAVAETVLLLLRGL